MDKLTKPWTLLPALILGLALFPGLALTAEEASHGAAPAAAPVASHGPVQPFSVTASLDWTERCLDFRVDLGLAAFGLRLPQGRAEAESRIQAELPAVLKDLVLGLSVDSRRDLAACIADSSLKVGDLTALAAKAQVLASTFSRDLSSFGIDYRLPLAEIESLLVVHTSAFLPQMPIQGRASRPYTGIVIYASGSLPVRGERTEAILEPSLFPRIYDETMTLLMDRNTVAPEALAAWGELAWATELDRHALARVGDDPLRIDARALFGNRRTDILIPRDEALKILTLPQNLELLAQGRVLVVVEATKAWVPAPAYPSSAPPKRQ